VVIIGAKGTIAGQVTLRYPLHQPATARLTASSAQHAVSILASAECSQAYVVGYGPENLVAPFAGYFRDLAVEHDIAVPEILRTDGQRYWSYVCTGSTCCPPEGTSYELAAVPGLTSLLAAGIADILPSRDGLAELVAPVTGAAAASARRATRRAEARLARLLEQVPASADEPSGRALVVREGIKATKAAMRRYQDGGDVKPGEAAWLILVLQEVQVRDDCWSRLCTNGCKEYLGLLLALTRLALPRYVAPPATLLAYAAWQSGNGALANVALDRALASSRDYTLAHTLKSAIDLGVHPSKVQMPLTPEDVAEAYASLNMQP
jgi:hypothetical protein